ncbi:MAG: hypothetical protein LCH85_08330 [Chloroflexi bacterium]|nr:hypothetical protein [Chloroflexota bacterium]
MTHTKEIRYDCITKDFALYLNGESIGYASSYSEGESRLNELVYDLLRRASHADISDLTPEDADVVLDATVALAGEVITENSEIEESATVVADVAAASTFEMIAGPGTEKTTYVNTPIDALARTIAILGRNWQRAIRAGRYADAERIESHEQSVRSQFRALATSPTPPAIPADRHALVRQIKY